MIAVVAAMAAAASAGLIAHSSSAEQAERAGALALRLLFWVVVPFMIICSLPSLHVDASFALSLALGHLALAISGLTAWAVATRVLRLSRREVGTLICCTVIANTSYLGLPVVRALLGSDDLPAAIAFDTLVTGPMFYVVALTIGALFGDRGSGAPTAIMRRLLLRNPPLFAAIAGLLLPESAVPDAFVDIAYGAIWLLLAVGFFAVGVTLASEARKGAVGFPPRLDRVVATAVLLRIAVAPAVFVALTAIAGGAPAAFRLEAAMPIGINSLVVAHLTGLDLRVTASAVAWSTAIVAAWSVAASLA